MQIICADILERMWQQSLSPERPRRLLEAWNISTVERDLSVRTSTNELTPTKNIESGRPTVGVNACFSSAWNSGIQDSHFIILEQKRVVFRRSDKCVKMCWPRLSCRLVHAKKMPGSLTPHRHLRRIQDESLCV